MKRLELIRLNKILSDFLPRYDFLTKEIIDESFLSLKKYNFSDIYDQLYGVLASGNNTVVSYFTNLTKKPIVFKEKSTSSGVLIDEDKINVKIDELLNMGLSQDEVYVHISREKNYSNEFLHKIYNLIGEKSSKMVKNKENSVNLVSNHVKKIGEHPKVG